MITLAVYNQLKAAASTGRFTFAYHFSEKKDIPFMENIGFEILSNDKKNYIISWEKATVTGDIESIDLSSAMLTEAQKLWVTAKLAPKIKKTKKQ